jgi:hypothetical protein
MKTKFITAPEHTAPCGRVVIHGITSGETDVIEFAGSPSVDAAKLARFAIGVGFRVHRKLLRERPSIKWFISGVETSVVRCGFADQGGRYIALADHLQGRELVETALHELRHLAQEGVKFTDLQAEEDAERFGVQWCPVVLKAYQATRGDLSRLAVVDKVKPSGWAPHMDVRVTLPNAKLWERNNRTVRDAWREISGTNEA